jgi:hypothetical protein
MFGRQSERARVRESGIEENCQMRTKYYQEDKNNTEIDYCCVDIGLISFSAGISGVRSRTGQNASCIKCRIFTHWTSNY